MITKPDDRREKLRRTLRFPSRAVAPLRLLLKRAARGAYWAESVAELPGPGPKLTLTDVDDIQRPRDGAGPLNHRTYTVRIENSRLDDRELIEAFRADPNRFSPTSFATFVPDRATPGLVETETYEVKLPGPWNGPVHVRATEDRRLRLETLDGHMEAGWIEFSANGSAELLSFKIESFARSGDAVFDALYHRLGIGKFVQTEMWVQVLESVVAASGGLQQGRIDVETTIYLGDQP